MTFIQIIKAIAFLECNFNCNKTNDSSPCSKCLNAVREEIEESKYITTDLIHYMAQCQATVVEMYTNKAQIDIATRTVFTPRELKCAYGLLLMLNRKYTIIIKEMKVSND